MGNEEMKPYRFWEKPARCPHCGYTPGVIPSDFDAYAQANCEHRESRAKTDPAPLREDVEGAVARLKVSVKNVVMGGWKQAMPDLDIILRHISDLTRRLAEAEAERDEHRDNATMLQGRCASALAQLATRERECLATMEQLIGERVMLRGRAESAEARVRELEAFKARVMEWARGRCGTCGTETESDDCRACRNGYDLEEYPQAAQYADNWTPPQAWEVGV